MTPDDLLRWVFSIVFAFIVLALPIGLPVIALCVWIEGLVKDRRKTP